MSMVTEKHSHARCSVTFPLLCKQCQQTRELISAWEMDLASSDIGQTSSPVLSFYVGGGGGGGGGGWSMGFWGTRDLAKYSTQIADSGVLLAG